MLYIIKFPPFDDIGLGNNYLHYEYSRGFYLGSKLNATIFTLNQINMDKKLKEYLKGKSYILEKYNSEIIYNKYRSIY